MDDAKIFDIVQDIYKQINAVNDKIDSKLDKIMSCVSDVTLLAKSNEKAIEAILAVQKNNNDEKKWYQDLYIKVFGTLVACSMLLIRIIELMKGR